jgi:hypothetical protein
MVKVLPVLPEESSIFGKPVHIRKNETQDSHLKTNVLGY